MAYFRGESYIWRGDDGIHFWVKDGYDYWDITSWAEGDDESRLPGYENASGVCVPYEIIDAFVMMRVAQLIDEGKTDELIDRATDDDDLGGNFGSAPLARNASAIKRALRAVKMEAVQPRTWPQEDAAPEGG